jgi:hypothetical protein
MSPSIDLIQEGHNLWKRVWLTEFIRNLVFSLVISLFFYSYYISKSSYVDS